VIETMGEARVETRRKRARDLCDVAVTLASSKLKFITPLREHNDLRRRPVTIALACSASTPSSSQGHRMP